MSFSGGNKIGKFVIVPGHDKALPGAIREGITEHGLMEQFCDALSAECTARNIEHEVIDGCKFVTEDDLKHSRYNSLGEPLGEETRERYARRLNAKIDAINQTGADYCFEFHLNANGYVEQKRVKGMEVYVYTYAGKYKEMEAIEYDVWRHKWLRWRGFHQRKDLAILRKTKMKAFLFELAFINNPYERQFFIENMHLYVGLIADMIERINDIKKNSKGGWDHG